MKLKWVVELEVDEQWVADGFDLTDDRALDMLNGELPYASLSELNVRVIESPAKKDILKIQGY